MENFKCRHCFCKSFGPQFQGVTFGLAGFHKDVNKLVLLSGHDSVGTMWRERPPVSLKYIK